MKHLVSCVCLLENAPQVMAAITVFVNYNYGLFRKCFCTARSLSVECWRSVPAVHRAATSECVGRQYKERTWLVCRARC